MSETREQLQSAAKITHDSIEWWKKEMSTLITRTEHWEAQGEDHASYNKEMEEIHANMNYLLKKGQWENTQLLSLQQKINKFESSQAFNNFELIEKKKKK